MAVQFGLLLQNKHVWITCKYLTKVKIQCKVSFNFLPKISQMYYHFSNCSNILIQVLFTAELQNMNEMKLFLSHPWIIHCPLKFYILPLKKLRAKLTRKFDTSCNMQDCTTFKAQKFLLLSCRKTALCLANKVYDIYLRVWCYSFFSPKACYYFFFSFKRGNFFSKNLFALETRKYLEMPFPLVNNFAKVPKDSFLSAEFQIGRYFYRVLHLKIVMTKRTF